MLHRINTEIAYFLCTLTSWLCSAFLFLDTHADTITKYCTLLITGVVSFFAIKYYKSQIKKNK